MLSTGTARHTVYDADNVRGNADSPAEELVLIGTSPLSGDTSRLNSPGTEVVVTVTLRSGVLAAVRGLRFRTDSSYGLGTTDWAFDRAGLAALGATVADVTGVVSFGATDHDLTWQQLGFDL